MNYPGFPNVTDDNEPEFEPSADPDDPNYDPEYAAALAEYLDDSAIDDVTLDLFDEGK